MRRRGWWRILRNIIAVFWRPKEPAEWESEQRRADFYRQLYFRRQSTLR